MGRALEPVIEPLGFDWKIGVGLVGAFAAREVFVSTMGVIYGLGENFDGNLRRRDLERDTPYNTYTRAGLTPTPISTVWVTNSHP